MKNFMIALSDVGAASGLALGLSNVYNILGIILISVALFSEMPLILIKSSNSALKTFLSEPK